MRLILWIVRIKTIYKKPSFGAPIFLEQCRMRMFHLTTAISCIMACGHASDSLANETHRILRNPDSSILRDLDAEDSGEVAYVAPTQLTASIETVKVPPTAEGNRMEGIRGKESPAGPKQGRYGENGFERSGLLVCVGRFAKPSVTSSHRIGYVGGGTAYGGERRNSNEGTFGMDYSGSWFARKSWLKWSHGERYQGGQGRYETDGPRRRHE